MQKAHKAVLSGQYLRTLQRGIVSSLEIRVHSRLFLPRHKGCTNARSILSRSSGHEEFKNGNAFSVQMVHKAVRARQYLRRIQLRIVPSMEIRVHLRLILARYKGCTNIRCTLSRSYGHEELKCKPYLCGKCAQSCMGSPISPSNAEPYSGFNGNSRTFASNAGSVQRLY